MAHAPQFSIITPSFRQSEWLKLCIAAVADQKGATWEHIVQDACSDDGTREWLCEDRRVAAFIEPDTGMYDALNRGLRRARGEFFAQLNCDEQYLPGALRSVAECFKKNPDIEIVFGDVVVIGADGTYRFHRVLSPPTLSHTWTCRLSTLTCATFARRSFIERNGLFFNPALRCVGDGEWMIRALQHGPKMGSLGRFVAAFAETGANLSASPEIFREFRALRKTAPAWMQRLGPLWTLLDRLRRAAFGAYAKKRFCYSVYTLGNSNRRETFQVQKSTGRWRPQRPQGGPLRPAPEE